MNKKTVQVLKKDGTIKEVEVDWDKMPCSKCEWRWSIFCPKCDWNKDGHCNVYY